MNRECSEIRSLMERSVGFALGPDESERLERHCAACESCREHRRKLLEDDALLAELAAPGDAFVERVRERAIARVRAAGRVEERDATVESIRARGSRSGRASARFPRIAMIAAAAATVVIAFVVIDLIRGAANGPVPAFAAVQEKMQNAENVVYRVRLWQTGQWTTHTHATARPHMGRREFGDSTVISDIRSGPGFASVTELRLYPTEKRAVLYREVREDTCSKCAAKRLNAVDLLAGWYKMRGFSFVRKERLDGKPMAVYEHRTSPAHRVTAWVDLDTDLLARLEVVSRRPGPDTPSYFGLRLNDFLPSGSKAKGWIELKPDEPCMILDDFRWNAIRDTSYFSTVPPVGYRVERSAYPFGHGGETGATEGHAVLPGHRRATQIAQALAKWIDLSGNVFPKDVRDLNDSGKIKPLLLAKFRRGGDPAEEYRAALRFANEWNESVIDADILERLYKIQIYYNGEGAVFGDSNRAICWIKEGDEPYHIVYADLHVAASPSPPTLGGK
jgi:hypothetical protein